MGGGLQNKGRQRHLESLRWACLIAFLYCLRQQIGKGRQARVIRDVSGTDHLENAVLCVGGVCKINRTKTKQLLMAVN